MRYGTDFQLLCEQFGTNGSEVFSSTENWLCRHVTGYPAYQRFFSRAAELSVLAEGRHIFGRRPTPREKRAGHYKDLTETGNRARKVSGTQGSDRQGVLSFQVFLNRRITLLLVSP